MDYTSRFANNFDLIRLVAAVFVLITHSYAVLSLEPTDLLYRLSNKNMTLSALGVRIFFVLSGFLIAQSFFSSSGFISYAWKRCLRIVPALFVVIVLSIVALGPLVSSLSLTEYFQSKDMLLDYFFGVFIYPIGYHLPGVFSHNPVDTVNASLWTIPYEFTYYILIAAVLYLASLAGSRKREIVLLLWLAVMGFNIFFYGMGYHNFWIPYLSLSFNFTLDFLLFFLSGTLCFLYRDKLQYRLPVLLLLTVCWIAVFFIYPQLNLLIMNYVYLPYAVFYAAFLRGRANHFGKYGDFSYGFYLYAFPVQQTVLHFFPKIGLLELMGLAFVITMCCAYLSWNLVEKRALHLKNVIRADSGRLAGSRKAQASQLR